MALTLTDELYLETGGASGDYQRKKCTVKDLKDDVVFPRPMLYKVGLRSKFLVMRNDVMMNCDLLIISVNFDFANHNALDPSLTGTELRNTDKFLVVTPGDSQPKLTTWLELKALLV